MDYDTNYQKTIISMLLSDPEAWRVCVNHFKPEYFWDEMRPSVRFIGGYYQQYGRLPAHEQIAAKTSIQIAKFSEPQTHTQATIDSFENFIRHNAMEFAILGGIEKLRLGRGDIILEEFNQAHNLSIKTDDHPFDGLWIDECELVGSPTYLIARWLVSDTVTCVYGAPGSYKSFYCLEAAFCLAAGIPFGGQHVKQTSVVYVAAEGQRGVALRIEALRVAHGKTPARNSFRLITQPLNLIDDDEVTRFIGYLENLQKSEAIKIGLIVLDTYSQCIAGADENSQAVASKASANMIRIRRELDTTVVYVHHTGKDATRGMRGSDALRANTDGAVEIIRDEDSNAATAVVRRSKDAPIGDRVRFQMRFHKVARLAGHELDGSLVPEFLEEQPVRVMSPNGGRAIEWLEDLWTRMESEPVMSSKRALVVTGRHANQHYKDRLAQLLPLGQEVDVKDSDGNVLGRLMRSPSSKSNNQYGEITRISGW